MLDALFIKNVALIKELNIQLNNGFTVFTGETGAGKSIIIDSIGLLLGKGVSKDIIRSGEESATVSGIISEIDDEKISLLSDFGISCDDEKSICVQKDISRSSKSVTRINGRNITASMQRETVSHFITIHGQNDGQSLFKAKNLLNIIDSFVSEKALLDEYKSLYTQIRNLEKTIFELEIDDSEKLKRVDMLKFQLEDIKSAKLRSGESAELEEKKKRLLADEKIRKYSNLAYRAIYNNEKGLSATDLLSKAVSAIDYLSEFYPSLSGKNEKIEDMISELTDIAETINEITPEYDDDPTVLIDKIEARLDTIDRLKRKYGADESQIIEYSKAITKELENIENSSLLIESYTNELLIIKKKALDIAKKISDSRKACARTISNKVCDVLSFLDMPGVKFDIDIHSVDKLLPDGCDEIAFLISPNPGEPLMPIDKIASGGELSRILLAIKSVIADEDRIPTVIFDEIDSGVSGKTSRKIGIKLKELSRTSQVICITHSAQIASLADTHIKISKSEQSGRTETSVKELDLQERIEEIARILGGIEITDTQRKTALELIQNSDL